MKKKQLGQQKTSVEKDHAPPGVNEDTGARADAYDPTIVGRRRPAHGPLRPIHAVGALRAAGRQALAGPLLPRATRCLLFLLKAGGRGGQGGKHLC